jgi:sortase A
VQRRIRILSIMLITAGIVVLADAGLTLVWQEPLSAAYGSLEQSQAEDQLNDLEAQYPSAADLAAIAGVQGEAAKAEILAGRFEPPLQEGHAIGRIKIDRIGLDIVVVQGTDTASLQKGPGHYKATPLPGQPGTVAIAGHRTTYGAPFRKVDKLDPGDRIELQMPYGDFVYRIERTKIVPPTELSVVDRVEHDRLVLSACHPLYSAAQRIIVFARLDSSKLQ